MTQAGDIRIQEWSLPSATGIGTVQARTYFPAAEPVLILQVIHGMAEHMGRYDAFARDLAARGILVVLSDLPGHGHSAPDSKHLGFAALKNGWRLVLADQHAITIETMGRHAGLPYFLFGHSMGSFLASAYIAEYGSHLAGVVLSGPAGPKGALLPVAWLLTRLSVLLHGPFYRDESLDRIARKGRLSRIPDPVSQNDYLSADPDVVKAYDADPLCGFCFTSAGFRDLNDLLLSIQGNRWARRIPPSLSMMIMAGGEDPVGDYGRGPAIIRKLLEDAGHRDVKMIIYEGVRHEPHQGKNQQAACGDIAAFLLARAAQGGQT